MGEKLKIGILYLGLHNELSKKYGKNQIIPKKVLFYKLGMHFHLSKSLRPFILDEMVKLNLIEKVNRDEIKILPFEIDIEKDQQKLFSQLNIL